MTDLARLRQLAGSATPAAWDPFDAASWKAAPGGMWSLAPVVTRPERDYIAAFNPTTAAALLDEIESLRRVRDAAQRALDAPWTDIETSNARALFDKAKRSATQEVTISAQALRLLLPAIESEAVVPVLRGILRAALLEAEPLDPEGKR